MIILFIYFYLDELRSVRSNTIEINLFKMFFSLSSHIRCRIHRLEGIRDLLGNENFKFLYGNETNTQSLN